MTKDELDALQTEASQINAKVYQTIVELTKDEPLILFKKDDLTDEEEEELQDNVWELPYSYYVGKYQYYLPGVVWKVQGENVTLFMTGEEWGETYEQELHYVPVDSRINILEHLMSRL